MVFLQLQRKWKKLSSGIWCRRQNKPVAVNGHFKDEPFILSLGSHLEKKTIMKQRLHLYRGFQYFNKNLKLDAIKTVCEVPLKF